jgi:ATP-dependent exoDNAse (exonuclease V) beta subunit
MVKSRFVTASAGSGKTFCLTKEVRRHIACDTVFIVAATFTRMAAAEMEKRIIEEVEKGSESPTEKLRLIMRAAKVHFSTIDALFHQLLSTEEYVPQVANDHERALITAGADERFFQHPGVLADIESILIAARILNLQPESLIAALDRSGEALAGWECPDTRIDALKGRQARIVADYERLQNRVRELSGETRGALRTQVVNPLLEPLADVDLGRALFTKSGLAELRVADADRRTPAYAALKDLYPPMRRLIAEHLVNTKRLRSALLKRFGTLRAGLLAEAKQRLGRLYFEDIPRALLALDGPGSPDRPLFMGRLYELGFHRTTHLLLDEFQDTSRIQFDLLRPLLDDILACVGENAEGERSLFLVGDWKQSIYQWRDAAPDHLKACIAPALLSGQIAVEPLPHNYRSTPLLIAFFNHLVAELFAGTNKVNTQSQPQEPKHPYSGVSEVAVIPAQCGAADDPAYERLVEAIRQKQADCGCTWGDMAVLCRTNAHTDKVAVALARAGILSSGLHGRELLSLREGTALYLSLVALFGEHDGRFIPRALSMLGYGEALTSRIARLAEAVRTAPRPHRFSTCAAALRDLLPFFPRVLIETLWDEAERYFNTPDAVDVSTFMHYLLKMSHLITVPEGEHADRVKLATIHGTKGLEFPHVFLFWKEGLDKAAEIRHPEDGCPFSLTKSEIAFLATHPMEGADALVEAAGAVKEENAEETANILYVAATRAVKSLTILLRADREGNLKGFSDLMFRAAGGAIPDAERTEFGWRHDYGPEKAQPSEQEPLTATDLADFIDGQVLDDDVDPTLRSADIEAGIERGLRIHAALAGLTGDRRTIDRGGLDNEEAAAVNRFLRDAKVSELLFRPGTVRTEQHLSDTRMFGIVDRLIIAPDRITLIDFKTGRVGHLADKYLPQMLRYRTILEGLFGERPVEGYLLFVDDPHRIVTI